MGSSYGNSGFGQGGYGAPAIEALTPAYYLNLITSQYRQSPNFQAWLAAAIQPLVDINLCVASFLGKADVDYAVGVVLDILGTIPGVSRQLPFQPSNGVSPILDDATFRLLIKATIAKNQWDGTQDSLQGIWATLFPGASIAVLDNQNMTALVVIPGEFDSIIQDLIYNGFIVPRPQAVEYRYTFASAPLVGWDQQNSRIVGWDGGGHWS